MIRATQKTSTFRPRRRALTGATVTALGGILALGLSACGTTPEDTTGTDTPESTTTVTGEAETSQQQGSKEETSEETTRADTSSVTTPASEQNPPQEPLGDPSMADQWVPPEGEFGLRVADVRAASHNGFDRVVFDLEGEGTPGWFTTLTENPTQQGSGNPVDYNGSIALLVGIEGTPYPNDRGLEPPRTEPYPGAGNVNEIAYTSLFEGRTEYVIGLDSAMPYSVTALEEPKRLVIDFAHQ